jgi:DNA-directed RNA polymerase subunit RPC12/RpoP
LNAEEATHLSTQDRLALALRITSAVIGFSVIAGAAATSSWNNRWVLALLAIIVLGGAVVYYLLTSVVRCPSCRHRVLNLGIGPVDAKRKLFSCRRCGAKAWLREGFYWQGEING